MDKNDTEKLNEWIKTFTVGEYADKLNEIIVRCLISRSTLRNWRYGACKIPPLAKEKIEEMAGKKIFNEYGNGQETNN